MVEGLGGGRGFLVVVVDGTGKGSIGHGTAASRATWASLVVRPRPSRAHRTPTPLPGPANRPTCNTCLCLRCLFIVITIFLNFLKMLCQLSPIVVESFITTPVITPVDSRQRRYVPLESPPGSISSVSPSHSSPLVCHQKWHHFVPDRRPSPNPRHMIEALFPRPRLRLRPHPYHRIRAPMKSRLKRASVAAHHPFSSPRGLGGSGRLGIFLKVERDRWAGRWRGGVEVGPGTSRYLCLGWRPSRGTRTALESRC